MEGEEVIGLADLTGSMALESQTGIGLRHTATIVNDLHGRPSGINHQYVDSMCSGINGILHQLLDDRGGALYHLTSSYLISHTIRK
jgi:hypothetical protein